MPTIIAVANQKGGSGKSTTAFNLAAGLAKANYGTAVLDLDVQATITKWYRRAVKNGNSPFRVFNSSQGLIAETIAEIRQQAGLEVVLVDCPPSMTDITLTAVQCSDAVICPVKATAFDVEASLPLRDFVETQLKLKPSMRFMVFLNETHMRRGLDQTAREELVRLFQKSPQVTVLENFIDDLTEVAEVGGTSQTLFVYKPKSKGARQYMKLTKEVVECLAANNHSVSAS
jgi:chromosome partitioning protein